MKIPKKIQIMGTTVTVKHGDKETDKFLEDHSALGMCRRQECEILIAKREKGVLLPDDVIAESLLHECLHFLLWSLEYRDLMNDEPFVGRVSGMLLQVFKQIQD